MFSVAITPPDALAGLTIRQDLGSGRYALTGFGQRCILREWTWGERRRLLAACVSHGQLDRTRFVDALLGLLTEPTPTGPAREIYASGVLWLLGITPERALPQCTAAEVALAERFGWGPTALERESAVTLDRWLVQAALSVKPSAATRHESGWNQIAVHDD
ncbi:MAG: hypothetical protein ABW321_25445 [Polyangiales bacterium]